MILKQNFSDLDLDEIGQIFLRSMEPKLPILKRGSRWNKIWKCLLMILSFILFGCSIMLAVLERTFSTEIMVYAFVGIVTVLTVVIWSRAEKKYPLNMIKKIVQRKYGQPFLVEMKEDALLYKETEYLYSKIKTIVRYKNFLYIKADQRWLIIKANEDEKKIILSKMNEKCPICFVEKNEVFDLKQL